jgi:endonuclease YncB( thermonuclease family)
MREAANVAKRKRLAPRRKSSKPHPLAICVRLRAVLAATLFFAPFRVDAADLIVGRASVIDGDTLEIHGRRVRLFGIDAPESGQTCTDAGGGIYRCGQKAAQVLDARIGDGVVTCQPKDRDFYGRVVAVCRVYGEDLGAWMVGLGWAVAFRRYSTRYAPAEELAKQRKTGMWAGSFELPSDWRAEQRSDAHR